MIKRFFRACWKALKTFWVFTFLITLILCILVWFLGPLVAVADHILLESIPARLIAMLILVFLWGLIVAINSSYQRKKELADPEKAQKREREQIQRAQVKEEFSTIRECIKNAIKVVTTSNFYGPHSRSRYVLPWYLVIGTSNCGKTSLLLNSGLQFPLNEQADRHLYHLRPTENPECLYANQAVFIDTPGAYAESLPETPAHRLWSMLLKCLFRARPSRPLNGVIVCLSMRDIIDTDITRREHLARSIRTRLSEVLKGLRAHVPVYLVFTKCDTVAGFSQFFSHLSRAEREQIFGCPTATDETIKNSTDIATGMVRSEIKDLMHTLNAQIIAKIHQERDVAVRGDMFQFPQELAKLGPRIEDFIFDAFGPSRYHRPVMFRGFFFTSALSPKDIFAAAAHDGELRFQTGFNAALGEYNNGYFLFKLIQNYIIPEARLAGEDKEQRWGLRASRYGMQLAAAGLFLFAATFLGISFINNYDRIETLESNYSYMTTQQKAAPSIVDSRLALPELKTMEKSTTVYNPEVDSVISYGLGLYQGSYFEKATKAAYLGLLNSRLLPSLRAKAAEKIESNLSNIGELKPALQAYLMLCEPQHLDREFVIYWLQQQWSSQYHAQADTQAALTRHTEYMIEHGIIPITPDADLLARARQALLKVPLAEVAYHQMKEEANRGAHPPFTFRNSIGEAMSPFDGDTYPIPYLYTYEGFDTYLIGRCPDIIRSLTDDGWIFGNNKLALSALDLAKVYKDVRALYFRDYTQHWTQALQELAVRTPTTLSDASKLADQLSSGISPIVLVLRDLRKHTTLTIGSKVENDELGKAVGDTLARKATQKLTSKVGGQTARALTKKARSSIAEARAKAIEDAQKDALVVRQNFTSLDSLLDTAGNPMPALVAANDKMKSAADYFGALANSDSKEQRVFNALLEIANEKDDTLRQLESAAGKLPAPVRQWYLTVPTGGLKTMLAMTSQYIDRRYHELVLSVYNRSLRSTYPFNTNSERDANLDDFGSFFRAGGTLDSFNDTYLQPFINSAGQARTIMGQSLPISNNAIVQLLRANRVQSAFFTSGRDLGINFLIEPHALDAAAKQVTLKADGKMISYWHGPVQGASMTWPHQQSSSDAFLLEMIDLNGVQNRRTAQGDWGIFRLLQKGTIKSQANNTCLIEVQLGSRWAQFLIQFRNRANPFDPSVCSFHLPESLL